MRIECKDWHITDSGTNAEGFQRTWRWDPCVRMKAKRSQAETEFFQNSGIVARKFSKFQHFLKYWRNSDKISSKSEQKSLEIIQEYFFSKEFL